MKRERVSDELDRLLARPALPADAGFSARVTANLNKSRTRRPWFITAVVTCCLAAALITPTPWPLYTRVLELLNDWQFGAQVVARMNNFGELITSLSQPGLWTIVASMVAIMALMSFALRDQT